MLIHCLFEVAGMHLRPTLKQVLTGDGWGDIARGLFSGSGNPGLVGIFFASYHIILVMVLVNVVIAVLLDEFSKAVRSDREAANARGADICRNRPPPERRCPLERVARELSNYFSLEFLDQTIASHWRKVVAGARGLTPAQTPPPVPSGGSVVGDGDVDEHDNSRSMDDSSESLSYKELTAGLRALTYLPPVLFRQQHWEELVMLAGLCDGEEKINARGFACLLKQALWRFLLGEMSLAMDVGGCNDWDGRSVRATFLSLKGALSLEYGVAGDDDITAAEVADMAGMEEIAEVAWHRACSPVDPLLDSGEAVAPAAALGVVMADHRQSADLQDLIDGLGVLNQRFADLELQLAERMHDLSFPPPARPKDRQGQEHASESFPLSITQSSSGVGIMIEHAAAAQQLLHAPVSTEATLLWTTFGAVLQTSKDATQQIGSSRPGNGILTPEETPLPPECHGGFGSSFPKGEVAGAMVSAAPCLAC
jgi:hypothetical protein